MDQKTHLDWGFIIGNHLVVECSLEWINSFWKICRIRREMGHKWNIRGERGKNIGWMKVNSRMPLLFFTGFLRKQIIVHWGNKYN